LTKQEVGRCKSAIYRWLSVNYKGKGLVVPVAEG
jgi:hypothetical protein